MIDVPIQSLKNKVKINKLKSISHFQNILHGLYTSIFHAYKYFPTKCEFLKNLSPGLFSCAKNRTHLDLLI